MPRCLVKLQENKYVEWSTVVDAPVTDIMNFEELKEYINFQYGKQGMSDFDDRMKRVEDHGTSFYNVSVEDLIRHNRAGDNETNISLEEILELYKNPEEV